MAAITKEQVQKLREQMIAKRDKALAEYNKLCGFLSALALFDVEIVEEPDKEPEGEGDPSDEE